MINKKSRKVYFILFIYSQVNLLFGSPENYNITLGSMQEIILTNQNHSGESPELDSTFDDIPIDYRKINNLNPYLTPFKNCLIYLGKFHQLDIFPAMQVPVIQMNIKSALIEFPEQYRKKETRPMTVLASSSSKGGKRLSCPLDKFFKTRSTKRYESGLCLNFNILQYSSFSKPWNCEVTIGVLPSWYHLKGFWYHNLQAMNYKFRPMWHEDLTMKQIARNRRLYKPFPSSIPKIFILLVDKDKQEMLRGKPLQNFVFLSPRSFLQSNALNEISLVLTIKHGLITTSEVVTFCHVCTVENVKLTPITFTEWIEPNFRSMIELAFSTNSQASQWEIDGWQGTYNQQLTMHFKKTFATCHNYLDSTLILNDFIPLTQNRLVHGFVHFWKSILKNYTLYHENRKFTTCESGKISERFVHEDDFYWDRIGLRVISHKIGSVHSYFVSVTDIVNSMRFISCTKPPFQPLAFKELVKIFDMYIWISLVFITLLLLFSIRISVANDSLETDVVVPIFSTNVGNWSFANLREAVLKNYISVLMVLLEQGDPFPQKLLKSHKLRFTIGSFLLVAIVLCNAYKNSNVYNMIAPRQPIPYDNFDQLIEDGFDIFSRAVYSPISMTSDLLKENSTGKVCLSTNHELASADCEYKENEIKHAWKNAVSEIWSKFRGWVYYQPKKTREVLWKIRNQSGLHLNSIILALEDARLLILKDPSKNVKIFGNDKNELNDNFMTLFINKQQYHFNELISKCNKTALILPDSEAQLNSLLLRQYYGAQIHIGKEVVFQREIAFRLMGLVPPFVVQRIRGIESSGLFMWWSQYVRSNVPRNEEISKRVDSKYNKSINLNEHEMHPVSSPTMEGNVQVVFMIVVFGCFVSTILFVMELHLKIWRLIIRTFTISKYYVWMGTVKKLHQRRNAIKSRAFKQSRGLH